MFTIVVDSNEHYHGNTWEFYKNKIKVSSLLRYGCDYSVSGQVGYIGVERKSFSDYVRCIGKGKKRFYRQLDKLKLNRFFCLIVEGDLYSEIRYSRMNKAAIANETARVVSYGVPVLFASNRYYAVKMCLHFMQHCLRQINK